MATTAEALMVLDNSGADVIELGVPYSDPLADGPVIQVLHSIKNIITIINNSDNDKTILIHWKGKNAYVFHTDSLIVVWL